MKENKKVGFGVFANLDLDALNQRTPLIKTSASSDCEIISFKNSKDETSHNNSLPIPIDNAPKQVKTIDSCEMEVDVTLSNPSTVPDLYGPELPPNYSGMF